MDDVRCPKCRGGLRTCHRALGYEAVCAEDCGFVGPMLPEPQMALEACRHLCWQGIRKRLPTPEEEAAHRARHGKTAGWMVRLPATKQYGVQPWIDPKPRAGAPEGPHGLAAFRLQDDVWESYPHVDGRPVAWPEV